MRFRPLSALFATLLAVSLGVGCHAQAQSPQAKLRDEFRKTVFAGCTMCALNPQPTGTKTDLGKVEIERVKFTCEPGQDAVALIYRPKTEGKHPTVILQHFLGGSKDHLLLQPLLNTLANRGYLAVAIDGRYRGERQHGKSLEAAMVEALRTGKGHPFLWETAYDITRLLDYLQTRPDVDADHIGMTGLSEGGIETWMTAAMDDRIKVAVPIIGVTTFADAFAGADGIGTQAQIKLFQPVLTPLAKELGESEITGKVVRTAWERLIPGMRDRFDAPQILPLIAPRPLLILSHEEDELFPVAGARKAYEAAKARYTELKADDKIDFRVTPGLKHAGYSLTEINGALDWFDKWLKPAPATTN